MRLEREWERETVQEFGRHVANAICDFALSFAADSSPDGRDVKLLEWRLEVIETVRDLYGRTRCVLTGELRAGDIDCLPCVDVDGTSAVDPRLLVTTTGDLVRPVVDRLEQLLNAPF